MFTYELSNGEKVVSLCPIVLVEFSDWGQFVTAEEVHTSAKNTLEREWEAWLACHEPSSVDEWRGSENERAYKAHRKAVQDLPRPVFVGEEPAPHGPKQGFVPHEDLRVHAAYGGWDLREYRTHSAVRPATASDLKIFSEKEAWEISSRAFPKGSYAFNGDASGTHVEYREFTQYPVN